MAATRGTKPWRPAGAGIRRQNSSILQRSRGPRGTACGVAATKIRTSTRRSCRHRREELPGLCRADVRHLACRPRRGAGERQTSRPGARLYPRAFRREGLLRIGRSRHRDCAVRAEDAATPHHYRQPRLRCAVCRRPHRCVAMQRQRSRLAVLHLRHHRAAEGRNAHPPRAGGREFCLYQRSRSDRPGRPAAARRTDESRFRSLHDG